MHACKHTLSAYNHWHCQRRRFHPGRHRFNNYTAPRFPRFWRLGMLRFTVNANRRLRTYRALGTSPRMASHRRWLFPVRFDPIPTDTSYPVGGLPAARYAGLA